MGTFCQLILDKKFIKKMRNLDRNQGKPPTHTHTQGHTSGNIFFPQVIMMICFLLFFAVLLAVTGHSNLVLIVK